MATIRYNDLYIENVLYPKVVSNIYNETVSITAIDAAAFDPNLNFIDYGKGIVKVVDGISGNINVKYSSGISIDEKTFICELKRNEYNDTTNPTAYLSLTSYVANYTTPFLTSIGIYDNDNNLLAIAKFGSPIKLSNKIDTIFKIKLDM